MACVSKLRGRCSPEFVLLPGLRPLLPYALRLADFPCRLQLEPPGLLAGTRLLLELLQLLLKPLPVLPAWANSQLHPPCVLSLHLLRCLLPLLLASFRSLNSLAASAADKAGFKSVLLTPWWLGSVASASWLRLQLGPVRVTSSGLHSQISPEVSLMNTAVFKPFIHTIATF